MSHRFENFGWSVGKHACTTRDHMVRITGFLARDDIRQNQGKAARQRLGDGQPAGFTQNAIRSPHKGSHF